MLVKYKVFYLPFPLSELQSEYFVYADNEEDARVVFERIMPGVIFKSAEVTS
jgi:hypothetical protein